MTESIYKYPRQYLNASFEENEKISLDVSQVHYLRNVLRKADGDYVRVFNGADGEWLARLDGIGKKRGDVVLERRLREQKAETRRVCLMFSPIKKQRMDFLIEKAVELGVTDLYPIIMNRTENRNLNAERIEAQIVEAAEQCERLSVPVLHSSRKLSVGFDDVDVLVYVALERDDAAQSLGGRSMMGDIAFLIGPEGGFDEDERMQLINNEKIIKISLGEQILRAETAALTCLSYAQIVNSL